MELQELKEEKQKRKREQLKIQLEIISNLSSNIEYYMNAFDIKEDIDLDIDNYYLKGYSLRYDSNIRTLYKFIPVKRRWRKDGYLRELIVEWYENPNERHDYTEEYIDKINDSYEKNFFDSTNVLDIQYFNDKLVELVKEKYIVMKEKEENEAIEMIAMRSLA